MCVHVKSFVKQSYLLKTKGKAKRTYLEVNYKDEWNFLSCFRLQLGNTVSNEYA